MAELRSLCGAGGPLTLAKCEIAAKFGGGGHKMAAGAHLAGPLESAKKLVFEQIAEQFAEIDSI